MTTSTTPTAPRVRLPGADHPFFAAAGYRAPHLAVELPAIEPEAVPGVEAEFHWRADAELKERIRACMARGGIPDLPDGFSDLPSAQRQRWFRDHLPPGFDDPSATRGMARGDWQTVRSADPFERLYLDGDVPGRITREQVDRHHRVLAAFWREQLESLDVVGRGKRREIVERYAGEDGSERVLQRYPLRIANARERVLEQLERAAAAPRVERPTAKRQVAAPYDSPRALAPPREAPPSASASPASPDANAGNGLSGSQTPSAPPDLANTEPGRGGRMPLMGSVAVIMVVAGLALVATSPRFGGSSPRSSDGAGVASVEDSADSAPPADSAPVDPRGASDTPTVTTVAEVAVTPTSPPATPDVSPPDGNTGPSYDDGSVGEEQGTGTTRHTEPVPVPDNRPRIYAAPKAPPIAPPPPPPPPPPPDPVGPRIDQALAQARRMVENGQFGAAECAYQTALAMAESVAESRARAPGIRAELAGLAIPAGSLRPCRS